jgi:signal peptidase
MPEGVRSVASTLALTVVVVAAASLLLGSFLGQPVVLGYVQTDSMQPTLDPGDGFVAVPTALTGEPNVGDLVVFRSKTVNPGSLTTHRVVDVTSDGFVTRGDANPVTDQAAGEPAVQRGQIVAEALQFQQRVVVIPALGTVVSVISTAVQTVQVLAAETFGLRAILGVRGVGYLLFLGSVAYYVLANALGRGSRQSSRSRTRETGTDPRFVVAALAAMLVVVTTAVMVAPAGTHEYEVIAVEYDSPADRVVRTGDERTVEYRVQNRGLVPLVIAFEPGSAGVRASPDWLTVPPGGTGNADVAVVAPERPGAYHRYIVEHRYVAVLPQSVLIALHDVHPWIALIAVDATVAIPFYVLGVRVLGRGRLRTWTRDRDDGPLARVRRRVTSWYRLVRFA